MGVGVGDVAPQLLGAHLDPRVLSDRLRAVERTIGAPPLGAAGAEDEVDTEWCQKRSEKRALDALGPVWRVGLAAGRQLSVGHALHEGQLAHHHFGGGLEACLLRQGEAAVDDEGRDSDEREEERPEERKQMSAPTIRRTGPDRREALVRYKTQATTFTFDDVDHGLAVGRARLGARALRRARPRA